MIKIARIDVVLSDKCDGIAHFLYGFGKGVEKHLIPSPPINLIKNIFSLVRLSRFEQKVQTSKFLFIQSPKIRLGEVAQYFKACLNYHLHHHFYGFAQCRIYHRIIFLILCFTQRKRAKILGAW